MEKYNDIVQYESGISEGISYVTSKANASDCPAWYSGYHIFIRVLNNFGRQQQ